MTTRNKWVKNLKGTAKNTKSLIAFVNALMLVGVSAQTAETKPAATTSDADKAKKNKKPSTTTSSTEATELSEVVIKAKEEKAAYQTNKVASSRYTEPLRDTPQTITVINSDLMKDQGVTNLRDALRNVPGISFQAGEGGVPAGDQMTINGFSARSDMYIDGVRDLGGYTRDTFNIEQVEVVKGPNSSYMGRGSTGGSVNMVTKAPKMENFLNADFGYGHDDYYRSTLDINSKIPLDKAGVDVPAAFRLNGVYHNQDYAGRDFVHDERWGFAPSLAFGLGTPTRATISYLHVEETNLPSYGLPFITTTANPYGGASALGHVAPVPYHTFFGLADRDYEKITADNIRLKLEHDFNDNIKLENQTVYNHNYRDSLVTAPRLVSSGVNFAGINRQVQARDHTNENVTNITNLITKFETGKIEHTMVTSADYSYERETNYLRSTPTLITVGGTAYQAQLGDPFQPNAYDGFSGPLTRTGAVNEAYSDSIGLAIGDTIKITDQWILTLGARGDFFQTYLDQRPINNGPVITAERSDLAPSWKTGLTYKPQPYGSVYFGYATSFNPSFEGATTSTGGVGVKDLEPEESENFELGTKWDFLKEQLSLSAALFRTIKHNARIQDPVVTTEYSSVGETQVQGISLGAAGSITKEWKIFGGYSIMESNVNKSKGRTTFNGALVYEKNHELGNTPEQTASLWTTYKLPFNLELGTGVEFMDKRFSSNYNTAAADGYWLQGFMATYPVNEHFELQLKINNLWDKEYLDRVGGGHAIPGEGRTAVLTARVKF